MIFDYLIVGHGLAGAILADRLMRNGKKVLVFDQLKENSASKVAAGLVNPIAGKRFAKSWKADVFIPFALDYFKDLEKESGQKLFHALPIKKLFSSTEEQNTWMTKSFDDPCMEFVASVSVERGDNEVVKDEFGGLTIVNGGFLDVKLMLSVLAEKLQQTATFVSGRFDVDQLKKQEDKWEYEDYVFRHLIFCEGYQAINNPLFNWLPFSPNKGEVLEVENQNFDSCCIYNKGVYVVPLRSNLFKVGATYNWRELNEETTTVAQEELTAKLNKMAKSPFQVISHQAGIRPAVRDRKPLIGIHPVYHNISIFNGMGSKGVMMAPYLAYEFADVLEGKCELMPEVNILRYQSLYKSPEISF